MVLESNTEAELREKRKLFLENGAKEVWVCDQDGALRFYDGNGELGESKLAVGFPQKI